jgi:DNA (cytosine-5)-methyltransferase 1
VTAVRPPILRTFRADELVVDNFAGGGGASTGIEAALGRPVDLAINHDPAAIAMHRANHPETRHFCENIWEVDPEAACAGRPVGLAWFSPDCTHFSRAKGTTPRKQEIRGLAWVVIRWAKAVRPRVIVLENVEEFQSWGPLRDDGRPDPGAAGETFRAWLAELTGLGYSIEFRSLVAADYGAPTTRKRFYLVARADGAGIAWPVTTHGRGRAAPWRAAAEIIDWSLPCPSIFDRPRPLAEATQRRIAEGIRRFVIGAEHPFIIPVTHHGDVRVHGIDEPLRTVTAAHRGELALVSPSLVQRSWGEREGQRPRAMDIMRPLGTIVAGGVKHALVAAFMAKHYGGPNGHQVYGHPLQLTLGTVTGRDHHALTTAFLTKFQQNSPGQRAETPLHTVMAGASRFAEVRAFLIKYYGAKQGQEQQVSLPLHTVTAKARFGLVTIEGEDYEIADIGMRMLVPRELFAAQGFPDEYQIAPEVDGKPLTKTAQIQCAGNSVCPPVAEAIVSANVCDLESVRAA